MAEIRLERVTKTFPNGVRAVGDLDLRVAPGEFMVLVGPSGCGKTTTLRLIAGLEQPSHGSIQIDGKDMRDVPPHGRDVAMVFQRPALYPHLSVRDNLTFALKLAGTPRDERDRRAAEIASRLQLLDLLGRSPAQLSGGQQQRVALGRAVIRQPRILLLDEPLTNLDTCLRSQLRHELHLLHSQLPATILYVTHDPAEAMALGDRLAVLHEGKVRQVGTPTEVYCRPTDRFVAAFLGPMNFLDGVISLEDGLPQFVAKDLKLPLPFAVNDDWRGRPLTLGIRPESVVIKEFAATDRPAVVMSVERIEPLGYGTQVTLRRTDWRLLGLLGYEDCQSGGPLATIRPGQECQVNLMLQQGHWFDGVAGLALAKGTPAG
jgi:multiple sugar transport system ATP-binding protein